VVGQRHAPAALPPGNTRYPLYGRLGRSQGRSGLVRKISPPPGLDPRTDEPVASLYTDCAIPAHFFYDVKKIKSSPVYFSVFVFCVNLYLCFCVYICAFVFISVLLCLYLCFCVYICAFVFISVLSKVSVNTNEFLKDLTQHH